MHTPDDNHSTSAILRVAVTVGFATAACMWLIGFVTHLPGLRPPAVAIAIPLLAALALGGFAAGRAGGIRAGVGAGIVASIINLLIVGAIVASDDDAGGLHPAWWLVTLGTVLSGGALGAIGAALARALSPSSGPRQTPDEPAHARRWLARFALVTVAAAIPVLLSGGIVTSTGTGLAVPDWPTSYNANMFLYPLSKMTGGIYYEHAHRLFGSLIGLTTLALLIFILLVENRPWVKGMGLLAFVFVCAQGVLGGVRVTAATGAGDGAAPVELITDNRASLALAMVHGTTAQFFFAFLCVIAAVLSTGWRRPPLSANDPRLRALAGLLLAALTLQLVLGSAARHFNHMHIVWTHVAFAAVATAAVAVAAFRAIGRHKAEPALRRLGHALLHSVGLQILLGVSALLALIPYQPGKVDPPHAVVLATAHQALGAVLLGCAAALFAWSLRTKRAPAPAPA